jgi:hypothetical protein
VGPAIGHHHDGRRETPRREASRPAGALRGSSRRTAGGPPSGRIVTVGADVAACNRATLQVFRDQLRAGALSSCPCDEQHRQHDTDAAALATVSNDLLFIPQRQQRLTASPDSRAN